MSLPSQSSSPGSGRRSGSYGRRRKSRLPAFIVALAIIGGGAWAVYAFVLSDGNGPGDARAGDAPAETASLDDRPAGSPVAGLSAATETLSTPQNDAPTRPVAPAGSETPSGGAQPVTINQGSGASSRWADDDSGASDDMAPVGEASEPARAPTFSEPASTPEPSVLPAGGGRLDGSAFANLMQQTDDLLTEGRTVDARTLLNGPLVTGRLSPAQERQARDKLSRMNNDLFFSPRVTPGDTFVERYTVQSGDSLQRIAQRQGLGVDWRLIQRVNRINDPRRIRVGQSLKLVRGPFHCVVSKSAFRADVFAGPPDFPEEWVYVRSFQVGLGEDNGTPLGDFVVRRNSKLVDPYWVNPRTGERFAAEDPENPIGEHWIGIEGVGEFAVHTGYGLHGTIEPDSIGSEASMGCVRMGSDDIAFVYELLEEEISRVVIVP
ncbi:MAG: LysM peptidoglycan-binding domain-containing protein [Planctomycetota bacterium]